MRLEESKLIGSKRSWRTAGIWMVAAALAFAIFGVVLALWQARSLSRRLVDQTTLAARSIAATASDLALQRIDTALGRVAQEVARSGDEYHLSAALPSWLGGAYVWTGGRLTTLGPSSEDPEGLTALVADHIPTWLAESSTDESDLRARVLHIALGEGPVTLSFLPFFGKTDQSSAIVARIDVGRLKQVVVEPMLAAHGGLELTATKTNGARWDQPMSGALASWAIRPAATYLREQQRVIIWRTLAYLGLTALALATLLASRWLLLRVVRREIALARMKANFVADVSHELKTPLATIRLFCETLESGRVASDEKRREYYEIIEREATRLTDMINTILDFSRIEAGHATFELQPLDVGDVVREVYRGYQLELDQKRFEHRLSIEENLPAVPANRDRISQAMLNLLSNAVKYSDDERFLSVEVTADTRRGRRGVLISVHDRGIGIRPEERAHLFDGFFRSNEHRVRQRGGTGLGLALVKQIVDAHNGSFYVESRLVKGSTFRIFLPESEHPSSNGMRPVREPTSLKDKADAD